MDFENFKQEAEEMIGILGKVSAFLVKTLDIFAKEIFKPSDEVERLLLNVTHGYPIVTPVADATKNEDLELNRTLKLSAFQFTPKEIKEMPRLKDCTTRFKNNVYEIRYRKFGYDVSFSSKNPEIAKEKAREWLKLFAHEIECKEHFKIVRLTPKEIIQGSNALFGLFAQNYMMTVKKKQVKDETFRSYYTNFKKYLLAEYKTAGLEILSRLNCKST